MASAIQIALAIGNISAASITTKRRGKEASFPPLLLGFDCTMQILTFETSPMRRLTPSLKPILIALCLGAWLPSAFADPSCATETCASPKAGQPFQINGGERLSKALEDYATANGWAVVWNLPEDWIAPGLTVFHGTFEESTQGFIRSLASNGVDVHAKYFTGNKTMVVFGTGGGHE